MISFSCRDSSSSMSAMRALIIASMSCETVIGPLHHLFDERGDLLTRLCALILVPTDAGLGDDLVE